MWRGAGHAALPDESPAGPGTDDMRPGAGHAAPPTHRRRPVTRSVALAAGLVMIIGAAAVIGARLLPHGASTGAAPGAASSHNAGAGATVPGVFGILTVTRGCPAAAVRAAAARCPAAPECWNGLVVIAGDASARSLPCAGPHVWQTFAIAILPADAATFDQDIVAADPAVRAVCSVPVLLRSRQGRARRIPASGWDIEVLPPDEAAFSSGARAYRCVANILGGTDPTTSQLGP